MRRLKPLKLISLLVLECYLPHLMTLMLFGPGVFFPVLGGLLCNWRIHCIIAGIRSRITTGGLG